MLAGQARDGGDCRRSNTRLGMPTLRATLNLTHTHALLLLAAAADTREGEGTGPNRQPGRSCFSGHQGCQLLQQRARTHTHSLQRPCVRSTLHRPVVSTLPAHHHSRHATACCCCKAAQPHTRTLHTTATKARQQQPPPPSSTRHTIAHCWAVRASLLTAARQHAPASAAAAACCCGCRCWLPRP